MKDRLHYSFSGGNILDKVFRDGFSAPNSTLPQDDFDPESDWENSYDVIYTGHQDFSEDAHIYYGSLRINTTFGLNSLNIKVRGVRQLEQNFNRERQHLHAQSICKRDELFSLKEGSPWRIENQLKNQINPATFGFKNLQETGRLKAGQIEKKNAAGQWRTYVKVEPKVPVVSDWSLLAGIQTLPRSGEYDFSYFPQLERYYGGHKIRFFETFDARFGGRDVTLHGYVQTGTGITPSFYWVNDQGRLLIAHFAVSALVYNSQPCVERWAQNDK